MAAGDNGDKGDKLARTIQPAAFTPLPGSLESLGTLQGLKFPAQWYHVLQSVQASATGREMVTPPIRSLNDVLRALIPQLVVTTSALRPPTQRGGAWQSMDDTGPEAAPWLLAREPIAPRILWMVTQAWLEQTYREAANRDDFRAVLASARAAIRPEDLQWEDIAAPMQRAPADNYTARAQPVAYAALPALLAERAIARNLRIKVGGDPRALAWAPGRDGGVELLTWPPSAHIDKAGKHFYSYRIALTLQMLPGVTEPRIHAHYGVRRWRGSPILGADGQPRIPSRWYRAYLRPMDGWLGWSRANAFAVAEFGTAFAGLRSDGAGPLRAPSWRNAVPDIAARLSVAFPPANEYAADPTLWIGGACGVELAVVEMTPAFHHVGAGIGADEVEELTSALAKVFDAEFTLAPALYRLPSRSNVPAHPLQKHIRELPVEQRLAGLRDSVLEGTEGDVVVEVWWATEAMRDLLVDRVLALLQGYRPPLHGPHGSAGEEQDGEERYREMVEEEPATAGEATASSASSISSARPQARKRETEPLPHPALGPIITVLPGADGARLVIAPRPLGLLGDPLATAAEGGSFLERTLARAQQIVDSVAVASSATLSLVELPNYRDRSPEMRAMRARFGQRDPKTALRLGLARTGRVSQFVTPPAAADLVAGAPTDELRQRAESAALDGLRHLGFLPAPIGFQFAQGHHQLPNDLLVAAVRFIRVTRTRSLVRATIPVVVLIHTGEPRVHVWLPDGSTAAVRSYRRALLDLATFDPALARNQSQLNERLKTFLLHGLPNLGAANVVILVEAQNARIGWPGVGNEQLAFDAIRYGRGDHAVPVAGARGRMRLIRLRTAENGETPEWYVPGARPGSSAAGLWRDPNIPHLFYGTADKPRGMKAGRRGKQERPQEKHAIASLLEIVPAAVQADDRDADGFATIWAYAVEQWRRMGYLAPEREMTRLPLPLHLAEKMHEYVRVIATRAFPEEDDGDDEDEGDDVEVDLEEESI